MSTPVLSSAPEAPSPPANLPDVRELMEELVNEVAEESRAKTTRYQQGQQWKTFEEWCKARGFQYLPADPETVAVFIFTQGFVGKKPNTLRGYASSIAAKHRSAKLRQPLQRPKVAMVIKGFVNRAKKAGHREKQRSPSHRRGPGEDPCHRPQSSARPTAVGNVPPMPGAAAEWTSPSSR